MNKLIEKYISKISIYDINKFALKNNINLSKEELDYLYIIIKTRYNELLYNEPIVIADIQKNIKKDNFDKIFKLYTFYKAKYKNYL